MKQWLILLLKLIVASGLIGWLISSGRFDVKSLAQFNSLSIWAIGVALFFILMVVNSQRWRLLLMAEKVELSLKSALNLSLIGIFFNFFMPGGVGGDVVKAGYLMGSFADKKLFIGWSILVDRVLGLSALLFYSGITGLLFYQQLPEKLQWSFLSLSLSILLGFLVVLILLIFVPKNKIESFLKSQSFLEKVFLPLFYFVRDPKKIVFPFLLSLVGQACAISLGVSLIYFLNVDIEPWMVVLVFPFGFLATVLPIAPAGIGIGQAAFYYLFEQIAGVGSAVVMVITFYQAVQFIVGLSGGLLFVLYKKKR